MERFRYRAMNNQGRTIKGVVSAASEVDLYNQLQSAGLELLQCSSLDKRKANIPFLGVGKKIRIRELIQLFLQLEQMQSAGVPLLDALADSRDTTDNNRLRDVMSEIHRDVSEGKALSEAMELHPTVFNKLHISLVGAGEETGDMMSSYRQLIKYMKWVDEMQSKVRKATRYPMIVLGVVLITIVIMMTVVVPQIVGFIESLDQEIPFYTVWLMNTSDFFVNFWYAVISAPIVLFILHRILKKMSDGYAYQTDVMMLKMPLAGPLIRKINIARFCQTFGALFASGIDILSGIDAAKNTVTNRALIEALGGIKEQVQAGSPLSQAFNASGEFPSLVVRMLKVGEESGGLTKVMDQVSEFYTKDVDEAIQALISMIEPSLTAFLGGIIGWIALAVFGPIYSSFENIDF